MVILRPSAILKVTVTSPSGELLDLGGDPDLEVALLLVGLLELLGGAVDLDGIVDGAQLEVDLLGQGGRVELLVAAEEDVAHEGPLDHHEGELDAALEVLDLEPARRRRSRARRWPGCPRRGGMATNGAPILARDTAQDDRFLDPAVTLDRDLLDDDRRGLGGRGWEPGVCAAATPATRTAGQKKWRERISPGAHEMGVTLRLCSAYACQCSASASRGSAIWISRKTKFSPSASTSIRAPSPNCPRTMASASGSSTCFWIVRRSCRAP